MAQSSQNIPLKPNIVIIVADDGDDFEKLALSDSRWKLVCLGPNITDDRYNDSTRTKLLFRIDKDPNETCNLWDENTTIGHKMYEKLKEYKALKVENRVLPGVSDQGTLNLLKVIPPGNGIWNCFPGRLKIEI